MLKTLIKCMDLITLPLAIGGVFAGSSSAVLSGNFEFLPASLCLLLALFLLPAGNLMNRYFDLCNNYGQSHYIYINYNDAEMELPLKTLTKEGIYGLLILSGIIGLSLMAMAGEWSLIVAFILMAAMYFNSAGPKPLSHTPFNYLLVFLIFGPVCCMSTFLVQVSHFSTIEITWDIVDPSLLTSCSIGLLAANSVLLYNYTFTAHDKHLGMKTLATVLGPVGTRIFFIMTGLAVPALGILSAYLRDFPCEGYLMITPIICALINTYIALRIDTNDIDRYRRLQILANFNVLLYGLAMFIISICIIAVDKSTNQFF